jgi:D-tyrosyl-tRNA(Tyr) deacylase
MRAVVPRVSSAAVTVEGEVVGRIGQGLCVFAGVTHGDDRACAEKMAEKIWRLRIFEDDTGRMNRCAAEIDAQLLVVSQFTLYADTGRGRRPSFIEAAPAEVAEPLVGRLIAGLAERGASVATGRFRAHMAVTLTNDGPVTLLLEV